MAEIKTGAEADDEAKRAAQEAGQGISKEGGVLDLALEHDLVQKSGSFFSYGDERLGQGRNNAKGYLREHPDKTKEIERKVWDAIGAAEKKDNVAEIKTGAEADDEAKRAVQEAGQGEAAPTAEPPEKRAA